MKTHILLSIATCLLFTTTAFCQITFQKSYNTFSNGTPTVVQTGDGGYVIMGRKLIRTDAIGDTLWTKSYDFGSSAVTCAVQTSDGGYAIAGYTFSFGAGNTDCFISRTDSLGNVLWSYVYGNFHAEEAYAIAQANDGGFMLAGHTRSVGAGGRDSYLVRTDAAGNLLWTKVVGGPGDETAVAVTQTANGPWVFAGTYGMPDTALLFRPVAYVCELDDDSGNILWFTTYDGPGTEAVSCIRQTADGGYIFTGSSYNYSATPVVAAMLVKTDAAGTVEWNHYYGSAFTFSNSVVQTADGGYILAGQVKLPAGNMDACLIKTNPLGDTVWTRAIGGGNNDNGASVQPTTDGGYIVSGTSASFGTGFYLIKTDSIGNGGCNQSPTLITVFDTTVTELPVAVIENTGGTATPFTAVVSNGTTVNPICLIGTAISEALPIDVFRLFPNPSAGRVIVALDNALSGGYLQIVNIQGVTVFEKELRETSTVQIQLDGRDSGIYFVKVADANGYSTVKKLVLIRE